MNYWPGLSGLQAGIYIYIYMYSVVVHYRYCLAELRIGMPQKYVVSTLIGIPIYL